MPPQAPARSAVRLRAALIAIAALLAASCSSAGGTDVVRVKRADVPVEPSPTPIPVFEHPLTGVDYTGAQEWQERPALAVKVENSRASRPQSGLDVADLVYEELAEGGITRFVAVFHSQPAPRVGPVRSARMVDPDILAPLEPLFAYAGAVPPVVSAVRSVRAITDVSYDRATEAYRRVSDRRAPHNLYTSTAALWAGREGEPPQPMFTWSDAEEPLTDGAEATAASFEFASNSERVGWRFDAASGRYERLQDGVPHLVDDGAPITADNVVIQHVAVRAGSIVDTAGQASPDSLVLGEGEAIVLRDGRAVRGRWVRSQVSGPTRFVDGEGNDIPLVAGRTWVELVPQGRPVELS